ncbi:MAG: peptidase S8 [Anaerolineaceae bacterium]|jgi:subtilisin family serine protease|nr:MAG: peptidase S8 [Anaerolineaceae bacterium]
MSEEPISHTQVVESKNRSAGALIVFLLFALPMPLCLFVYHLILWFMEQTAIASLSLKGFALAGVIGLALQAVGAALIAGLLWRFNKDERFTSWYFGLFAASLAGIPALSLRALGPNNDQLGSILQTLLALIAAFVVIRFRKKQLAWNREALPFGLLIAGIGISPLVVYGAFGSFADAFLSLLAGLAFGFLTAVLLSDEAENVLLNGAGAGALLALLASALGYDGSQLILVVILPAFSFALAALLPSRTAAGAAVGVLAFAGLAFFDPTELTFLLGDILNLAAKAAGIALLFGWGVSIVGLVLRQITGAGSGGRTRRAVGWAGAGVLWMVVAAMFFVFGNPGNYSDRLFVIFKDQADISDVTKIANRDERLSAAYAQLTEFANATQMPLRNVLDKAGVEYTPYYLQNSMEVHGGMLMRLFLMTRPEVERVIPSPRLRAAPEDSPQPGPFSTPNPYVSWNIAMIGADKVWDEFGAQGEGIIVGQSDSGVDGNHPAIQKQYRGFFTGGDYNWFDPWDGTTEPNDEGGHGTHTLGTILGTNGIGVAPKAQWIGCVNLDRNLGNPALYLDCMQFMLAPFPLGGDPFFDGDPTKAAHVLNNSWGCPPIEGCDANALLFASENLRHAGIFVVVSTGNDGPSCETVVSPLSLYDSVFSVGAIDRLGNVAEFSSRGPVTADGSGRIKPDIAAPGVDIFSALPQGTYGTNSGTSMAGPHLVGVVALIWSAQPDLIGDIEATEQIITDTAQPYRGNTSLGCFSGDVPNNAYGYGVVDVYSAVKQALGK